MSRVYVSRNRVAELSVTQLGEILAKAMNAEEVTSITIGDSALDNRCMIQVRWSEPAEEREI